MKPKIIWFTPVYIEYNNRKKNIDIYISTPILLKKKIKSYSKLRIKWKTLVLDCNTEL